MQFHKLIVEKACLLEPGTRTEDGVLRHLLGALEKAGRLTEVDQALTDIEARERQGVTAVGNGIALPHACTSSVQQPMIAFCRSREGIDFQALDGKPVHLIFLLLGPKAAQSLHLKILGRLARLLARPEFLDNLRRVESAAALVALLKEQEKNLGEIEIPQDLPFVCVAGAGNGGQAMAAYLTLLGCRVNLFNRSEERLLPIRAMDGIQVNGQVEGFARLNTITTKAQEALQGVDLVMVVVPATGHRRVARLLGPHLRDGQILVLNPGRTGGALEFQEVLRQQNIKTQPFIAEAQTLLYTSRIIGPAQVHIFRIKNSVPLATLPAYHIPDVLASIREILPQFVPGDNVLKTGLGNIGSVFHPALTILNAAWIETQHGNFEYYREGASPSVTVLLEALDAERVTVAEALGVRVPTAREWLYLAYNASGRNLYQAMQANPGYGGIQAPNRLDHRYLTEDIPTGLVPLASLGDHLGVAVPTIKALIHLAGVLHRRDYWAEGRTVDKLGLAGLSVQQIRRLVEEGAG